LFGIPRAQTTSGEEAQGETGKQSRYVENTNLEQISDWLTKIIVGVTLVQFNDIVSAISAFSDKIAVAFLPGIASHAGPALGNFAFAILLFFAILGFMYSYLWTRLYLIKELTQMQLDLGTLGDKFADVANKIHHDQSIIDSAAINLVEIYIETDTNILSFDSNQMNDRIIESSPHVRTAIFFRARKNRKKHWDKPAQHQKMMRSLPIFEALVAAEQDDYTHRSHAQIAYILKDKVVPNYPGAIEKLRIAIRLRDQDSVLGYEIYEMNLAVCLIQQSISVGGEAVTFTAEEKSEIRALLEKGRTSYEITNFPEASKWLVENSA
jgi:hypothetical protein